MKLQVLKNKLQHSQGAALLTVLVALLLISLMTLELQYTSLIERKLAYNDLNKIQTHYLAKSGIRLGILRLAAFGKVTKNPGRFAAGKPYFNLIWNIPFPAYPPEKASLEKLSLQEKAEQIEALKDTRISTGQFSYAISSEASKLNLNLLAQGASTGVQGLPTQKGPGVVGGFIGYTLYQKINRLFKDSDSPVDEFGNVKPEEIIANLVEWVTPPGQSSTRDNSGWYERQDPPYKPKHGRFFTLDEVKLVKDMSPALFLKLKPDITVFSEEGKINLSEATQRRNLKLYFPRLSDYGLKLIDQQFAKLLALGQSGWGSVGEFFNFLTSVDNASASEYAPTMRDEFFTVESANFVIRSKGSIQKSGSTIESNLTVAVSFDPPRFRSPFPNTPDKTQCEKLPATGGGVWLTGKCVYPPFDEQECLSEG
ncbi:MAG: general secretion pathway protein GspK, partial [Pseudomonadota bacterium]